MSFLNISDPNKRDLIVKEYLKLKRNIRNNLLSERTGEQQLQTDLSKFFKPITETQKATTREITEELKPIKEGIEKISQATQPLKEAPEEEVEEEEEEPPPYIGKIAKIFLERPTPDKTFGVRGEEGNYKVGKKKATIFNNNIEMEVEKFEGTPGLLELLTAKTPKDYTDDDYEDYQRLMLK